MNWVPFAILSAVFAALTAILAKIGVEGINSDLAVAIRTTVILVFAWTLAYARGGTQAIATVPQRAWIFLVLSGLATGLSWLFYFKALQLGPASKVAPVDKLSVALTILLAFIFLSEKPTLGSILGGSLVAAGVLVVALVP